MKVYVASIEKAQTKNQEEFLRLILVDESKKKYKAVWFDPTPLSVGQVCEITLKMPTNPSYNPQVKALRVLPGEDVGPYMIRSPVDPKKAALYFHEKTRGDKDLEAVVDHLIFSNKDFIKKFAKWPAAHEHHHAFEGGLLEHSYMMAIAAEHFMAWDLSYAGLDTQLVFCSILLHDAAKVFEYDFAPGEEARRTLVGKLIGHISLADEMVTTACVAKGIKTDSGKILLLRHCILSHHGKKDWGSPVVPMLREAVLVHQLDMIQSRGQMAKDASESAEPGQAGYSKPLDCEVYNIQPEPKNVL